MIRSYMGFGPDGHNVNAGKTGFRANSNRSGTTPAHDWFNFPQELASFCNRLSGVVIENRDAISIMDQQDSPETLHFVDPPYVSETRGDLKHGYVHELSDAQHGQLCDFLKSVKGLVVLCGYHNEIYDSLGWKCVERKAMADGARERTEVLWLNPAAWKHQDQMAFDFAGGL